MWTNSAGSGILGTEQTKHITMPTRNTQFIYSCVLKRPSQLSETIAPRMADIYKTMQKA